MRKEDHFVPLWGLVLRAMVLGLVVAALIAAPHLGRIWAAGLILLALGLYLLGRRPAQGDFTYVPGAAIVIPDVLGITLVGLFVAFPIWATPEGAGVLHPSAWLMWPMAALSASIFYIAWRAETFALSLTPEALQMTRGLHRWDLPYAQICHAVHWRRDLPRWIRALVPFLMTSGRYGPAGAVMLARERHGIVLVVPGQPDLVIETDGLRPKAAALVKALSLRGISGFSRRPGPGTNPNQVKRPHCKDMS